MKSIIIIITILITLLSCDYMMIWGKEVPYYDLNIDLEIQGDTITEKIDSISFWIFANIIMKSDAEQFGYEGYWQTPEEVVENMAGDCEDLCILFLWLTYQYLDIKPRLLVMHRIGYAHSIGKYNNYLFADYYDDYVTGDYIYIDYYSWEDALLIAEYVK